MTSINPHQQWVSNVLNGTCVIDWDNDPIMLALLTDDYTPDENHQMFEDIGSHEVAGDEYTSGGKQISGIYVHTDNESVRVTGNPVKWAQSATGFSNARYGVIYHGTTTGILGIIDFGHTAQNITRPLVIKWHKDGIFVSPIVEE